MIKDYYTLAKPGIIYGNALTAAAGFLYASQYSISIPAFIGMLLGLSLIIGASCAVNNVLDRDMDAAMARTKDRALAAGRITSANALLYAAVLGIIGSALLFFSTNALTLGIALFGVVVYIGLYTPFKRRSEHAVLVGAFAGAVPPVIGYTAVTNTLDATALLFFIMLLSWQMVHFSAIALYRIDEYRAAGIPVFPIRQGARSTKAMMTSHALIFLLALKALVLIGHVGESFFLLMGALAIGWVAFCIYGFSARSEHAWARGNFFYSLAVLLAWSLALAFS